MHTQKYSYPASLATLFFVLASEGARATNDREAPAPAPTSAPSATAAQQQAQQAIAAALARAEQEQAQRQTQQQAAISTARQELNNANANNTTVQANPSATVEAKQTAQQRVNSANSNLNTLTAQGGAGGAGGMSAADVRIVNENMPKLTASQQLAFEGSLNPVSRSNLQAALTTGNNTNTLTTGASTANANGAAGNSTTTTIGGTNYTYSQPVAGAFVQLPPSIMPQGPLVVTTTTCGGDFSIEKESDIQSISNAGFGAWTTTRPNGAVYKTVAVGTGPSKGDWLITGQNGELIVQERRVTGYQAVVQSYIVGSSASSGLNINGQNVAGAMSGAGGVQSYGNHILKFPCSYTETRMLKPVPPPPPAPPAPPVPPTPVVAAPAPVLTQEKAPFLTGERVHLGPITPRRPNECPKTENGRVIWVPKTSPDQICGSRPVTAPAVTDVQLKK
jgi:hypothetical protein